MTTSSSSASTPMQLPNLPGHFYYTDLHTPDVDGAGEFYSALLGWQLDEIPDAPNRYVSAGIDGRSKGGITGLSPEQRAAGVPAHWIAYLWVADIDATVAKVPQLGGVVVLDTVDVFDMGRMAVITDSTGATLGLWQDATPGATSVKDEHGSPFWYELHTSDLDETTRFYGELLGWTFDAMQMGDEFQYHLIVPQQVDGHQANAGGVMRQMQVDRDAGAPSAWHVYINVTDCDASFARAQQLGASVVMEPHDIPDTGRSAWIADPQGAFVAIMSPSPRATP